MHTPAAAAAGASLDRSALIAHLQHLIYAALHRQPGVLLVRGATPDIMDVVLADPDIRATSPNLRVVDGECVGIEDAPSLWRDVLRHWPRARADDVTTLFNPSDDVDDATEPCARPDALFSSIASALRRTQERGPIVMVLHDVACIDAESAAVLLNMAERLSDERIAIIAFASTWPETLQSSSVLDVLRRLPTVRAEPTGDAHGDLSPSDAAQLLASGSDAAQRVLAFVTMLGSVQESALVELLALSTQAVNRAVRHLRIEKRLRQRADGSLAITSPALRRALHTELLRQLGPDQPDATGVAPPDMDRDGDLSPVPDVIRWLVQRSVEAQQRYTWLAGAQVIDHALRHPSAVLLSDRQRGWLLYRTALYRRYATAQAAQDLLEQVLDIATKTHDTTLATGATYHHGLLQCWLGNFAVGIREMETTIASIEQMSDTEYAHLNLLEHMGTRQSREHRGTLVTWLTMVGRFDDALYIGDRRLDTITAPDLDVLPSSTAGGDGYSALGELYAHLGQPDLSRAYYEAARGVYAAFGHHHQVGWTCVDQLLYMVLPFAPDHVSMRRALANDGDTAWETSSQTVGGDVPGLAQVLEHFLAGDWERAANLCSDAQAQERAETLVMPIKLALAFHQSDTTELRALTQRVLQDGVDMTPGNSIYSLAIHAQRLAALDAAAAGDARLARSWLQALDRWLRWSRGVMGDADRHIAWAVYYLHLGQLVPAREHVFLAYGRASDPRQPLSLLAARRVQAQVALGQRAVGEARRCMDEALGLARACASVPDILACQAIEVRVLRAENRHGDADVLEAVVTEQATRMGAQRILDSMAGRASF